MAENLLEMKGITKYYPGVVALDKVDFSVTARRSSRPAGRERRRQIYLDQDPGGR